MNRRVTFCVGLLGLTLVVGEGKAFQINPAPSERLPAVAVPTVKDLEQAVQDLQYECACQAGSPDVLPQREQAATEAPVVLPQQPISAQCRVITAMVHFSRLRVPCDEGPDLWYTVGFFQDPTDQKTYRFRFNDMGAAAGDNDVDSLYVVVFRPADRELSESEITAMIPLSWVEQQQGQQQQPQQAK